MPPQIGMVIIHAHNMRYAMLHLTALSRLVAPTPITEPEITCVVESGMPNDVALSITSDAVVCAEKPWIGSSLTIFLPSVRIIRQPPTDTPPAIVAAQTTLIQVATSNFGVCRKVKKPGK